MNHDFHQYLFQKQQQVEAVPSNKKIAGWALRVLSLLYPQLVKTNMASVHGIKEEFNKLKAQLKAILEATQVCEDCDKSIIARSFFEYLPELYRILNTDIEATLTGDPAAKSYFEIIRTYPGFFAIAFYRMAHALLVQNVPLLPRILTEYAHSKTGIDIHPGADIGEHLHIDHGTGIVIGETTKIGKGVKLYQGVTLGALSVDKSLAFTKRHPTVEDNVVIYSGATILGGETVIGHNSVIGGNVWLTSSVPPGSMVYHKPEITVVQGKFITQ